MGDRSLIVIQSENSPSDIVFYGHWSGSQNYEAVLNVLRKTTRVGDDYLTAELFHEFSSNLGGYTGTGFGSFGIFTAERGFDEGWVDSPTVYVSLDTGDIMIDGITTTYDEIIGKSEKMEEKNVIY